MIPAAEIGKAAAESPLALQPPIEGHFTWLSTRSGSFAPAEVLPLSTTYLITLTPGLKDVAGKAVSAPLRETVQTPPVRVKGAQALGYFNEQDAPRLPRYTVLFNTTVRAADAAKFFAFTNADGLRVAARVEQANDPDNSEHSFSEYYSDDRSLLTWSERFAARGGSKIESDDEQADEPAKPLQNLLLATPVKPLPPGKGWQLVIDAGVPSAEWNVRMLEPKKVAIGHVQPFTVAEVLAQNGRNDGRQLMVRFSKALAEQVEKEPIGRWISVKPEPKDFQAKVEGDVVMFTGQFALGVPYQVAVNRGVPAIEPFTLTEPFSKSVVFDRIAPRLYFEGFATHQLLTGTRRFRLLSVNVPRVRVTAKLFTGDAVPLARKAYARYDDHGQDLADDESYARIDDAKLPGQTIWQRELDATEGVDKQTSVPLPWDEILGEHKSGTVLLTAESIEPVTAKGKRVGTQALVQVTDLGAVWKRSATGTFVHLFSLANAKPITATKLRLLDRELKPLGEATTNDSGDALLPPSPSETVKWIFAERAGDSHLIAVVGEGNDVPMYRLGLANYAGFPETEENAEEKSVFLFTERGVYKPGEIVRLKGLARDLSGDRPRVPAGEKRTISLFDTRRRECFRKEVTLSEFGSFAEEIKLPVGTLGRFRITVTRGEKETVVGEHAFEVQEYRPNAFEITIPVPPPVTGPAPLELPITAKYFMGKPLSQAELTWSLVARDTAFQPEGFEAFAFCNAIQHHELNRALDRVSQVNEQGEVELDATGAAAVSVPLSLNPKAPQPRAAKLLCEITDLNQQTVSESRAFVRHSSEFYFGLRKIKPLLKQGEPLPVELIAVRTDGTPLPQPAQATLRLTRIDWQTNRIETAGEATQFESKARFEPVSSSEVATLPPSKNKEGKLIAQPAPARVVAEKPGQYLLEAIGRDAQGHDVLTSTSFYVYGAGETVWDYDNPYAIDLVPDKESYEAGQTATLLVKTPIAGEALVTVERDRVVRSFITSLRGNAPAVEIPLTDADAPNIFVSVMLLRGADESPRKIKAPEYRIGYCELKVARPDAKLRVYAKVAANAYRPGDNVELEAEVLNSRGKPAVGAEVTLYAVDEGVLSLTGYTTPDPLAFFNRPRQLRVETSLTLPTLLREDLAEAEFANKGYLIGDGKGGPGGNDGMRKNFLACAFWSAALKTDADGRARAALTAPDSLTRYRVIAVAQTKATQFGAGESAFEINKPVMLEPSLPRFANVGDKLTVRGVLHNTTDIAGSVDVELQLDATAKAVETKRRVALPAHGSVAVDFPVEFVALGRAQWKWSARFSGADGKSAFADNVQSELNVGYPAPLVREVHTKRIEGASADLLRLSDPQIMEGSGVVRVSLTNSRALELRESLRQLLEYPYGCAEQTTSSMLPWLTVRDLRATLPEIGRTDEQVAAVVTSGINRLLAMQTNSGGIAYWPGEDEPMLWVSAYVGMAMVLAQKQGHAIPAEELDRLLKYLSAQLRGTAKDVAGYGLSDRCLAVYALALAGRAEPAYHELLFKKRDTLSGEDRALLALALIESRGPAAMIEELLSEAPDESEYIERWFGSVSRENALHLLAWSLHQPEAPRVDALATELFGRRQGGHWMTTQGNAWSLFALATYLRKVEPGDAAAAGEIVWAGQKQPFAVSKKTPLATAVFPLAPAHAAAPMQLAKNADGRVFSEVTVEARPRVIEQPRQDRGYSIARRYAKLEDDGTLSAAEALRVGDRVLVTLDVEVRRRATYLAVEDPLPAVLEPLNPAFKSQETLAGERLGSDWVSSYHELREDRALFFADLLHPGRYTLRYLARVTAAGTATAPAAKIEEMYHPERFGTTGTTHMSALPLGSK